MALRERDTEVAEKVIADDARVDALDVAVQEQTVKLLALRQPMAVDLRVILSSIKIAAALERIADYAKNTAKRTIVLAQVNAPPSAVAGIDRLGRLVRTALKDVLDAFAHGDVAKARDVWERDEEIDQVYTGLFRELLTYMMEDPRTITACTHLLFMAKNIERAGDHVTNIAELVSFRTTGHGFDEARPKGSASLYAAGSGVMSMAGATTTRRDTQTASIKPRVLIVEDETALVELLRYNLEQSGFRVSVAYDGEEALASVQEDVPDLILLDWMLPLMSGIEVCRQLRRQTSTANLPIIMLTARGEEGDRVRGLDAGADDYVAKPFSPTELVARIRAVLRRIRPALADEALSYADIVMDLVAHRVTRAAKPVHLGPTEFRLLRHFMEHPGRVFSREQLLDAVWGKDVYVEARTVDVHIRRLRIALNGEQHADLIRTVRAAGYALDATPG